MTKGLITPTKGQEKQLKRIIEDTFECARKKVVLDKDAMQRLFTNGGKFQNDVIDSLVKHSASDDRFELLNSFELAVPKSYNHGTQLATFAKFAEEKPGKFYYFNDNITDANYAKAKKLIPGKTYGVKIFGIKKGKVISSPDCLSFLASQRAILVGAQGVSLAQQLKKEEFPVGKWTVSFDEKDALWVDGGGHHGVPRVYRYSDGYWKFFLGNFEVDWHDDACLVCFCDLSA